MGLLKQCLAATSSRTVEATVLETAEHRLANCPYANIFNKVVIEFANGCLTLRGSVPSFYLKQMLQEQLRGIDHVQEVVNEVQVVSSNGMSRIPN